MAFSENTKTEIQIREIKAKTILLFFYCDHDNSRGCFIYNNKKILKRDAE